MDPRLSVCVITRNRAGELAGLLANVRDIAGEIVVVDGGDDPETPALLAAEPKARRVRRAWDDDWGAAKNAAYDAAAGDWLLNVDTDERVGDDLKAMLPRLLRGRPSFYRLPMLWVRGLAPLTYLAGEPHNPCHLPRLFRNLPEHRYVEGGPLHPTFPKFVVRRMKKLRRGHLLHLVVAWLTRDEVSRRVLAYEEQDPASQLTNDKYYRSTWRRLPVAIAPTTATPADSLLPPACWDDLRPAPPSGPS